MVNHNLGHLEYLVSRYKEAYSYLSKSVILIEKSSILVMSERADCKWSIIGIKLDEKSKHFIHFILGSYSSKGEADKAFCAKKELTDFWSEGYANAYDLT